MKFEKKYIDRLSNYLNDTLGLLIDDKIKKTIELFVRENIRLFSFYQDDLNFDYIDLNKLINDITINETYFFRDTRQINYIKKDLAKRSQTQEKINIWSLGCSSGEEPYTMAILSEELCISNKVNISAFDINTKVIEKAKRGVYSEWSFRGVDGYYINKYFSKVSDKYYKISENIIKKVDFHKFNLKKDIFDESVYEKYGRPDIILCRNILMYFKEKEFIFISNQLENLLNKNGYVLTSSQENYILNKSNLFQIFEDGIFVFYKKDKNQEKVLNSKLPIFNLDFNNEEIIKNIIFKINTNNDAEDLNLILDNFIEENPYNYIVYLLKAKLLYNLENLYLSEQNIKKALFLNPFCPISNYEYGRILIKNKINNKAVKYLIKSLKLLDKESNNKILSIFNLKKDYLSKKIEFIIKNSEVIIE
ncbi:MAG: CheR family methyltransferase [Candidatus Sericytochromatia bacterium]